MDTAYALVARIRARELKTRLGLALFLGAVAYELAPSIWPFLWLAAMVVGQLIDLAVYRPLIALEGEPSLARKRLCMASAALNTAIYSATAAYLWFNGGEAGRLFGLVQVAGGLLHVTLHMHHIRPLLIAAAIPHAGYLLGLPLLDVVLRHNLSPLGAGAVAVAGLLYVAHLVVAARVSGEITDALREERRRAEEASAAKSDFLAVISHEIRTPMNAVTAAATLLRRTALTPVQTEHVAMLEDAGEVLVGLLTDVLDLSKIEAGKMSMEAADHPVRAKLESLAKLWRPRAEEKGVTLEVVLDDRLPDVMRTDPLRFQQVLFNLLSNAVKFTASGRIELRATVEERPGGPWLDIRVSDTGCGVAPEALERIFQSFEQADAGVARRQGGAGLGLAISRRLAELLGGTLTAESRPGEGSTFRLSLPLDAGGAVAEPPEDEEIVAHTGPLTVLVVEDHAVNRRIVGLLLEPLGCHLVFAEDGEQAVAACEIHAFDAILMDMQMPVMDGLTATRAIRAGDGWNAGTPIIALTANAMDHHRAAWAAVGVDLFLTKPIVPDTLFEALSPTGLRRARARPVLAA